MAKILNLDELSAKPAEREIVIAGKSYPIPPMTVDNFIETSLAADRLDKTDNLAEQVKSTVEMIVRAVPGVPREALGNYSIEILGKIAAFVHGSDLDDVEAKVAAAKADMQAEAAGK